MDNKIKVLIVDDSLFMRNILERMIKGNDKMQVIGKAENGLQAIEMAKSLNPDVITLDIEMPKMDGLQALERIMAESRTAVVMISSLTEAGATATVKALEIGAVDFIPKALDNSAENIFKKASHVQNKIITAAQSSVSSRRFRQPRKEETIQEKVVMPRMSSYLKRASFKVAPKVLLIGSSTGGPKALGAILSSLKADLKIPVVIAQHMPAGFTKALADRFDRDYDVNVKEVIDGDALKAGQVYIAQGGKHLRIEKSISGGLVAKVSSDNGESPFKPSVDVLAESILKSVEGHCLCVMLTGMGSDGSKEFKKLHDKGAYVITQSEDTCTVYGMPKSVDELKASDEQLAIDDIAGVINSMVR